MNRNTANFFNILRGVLLPVMLLSVTASCREETGSPIYRDPGRTVAERAADLSARMTLAEKIEQLSGVGFETRENKRLAIPALKMADGPVGVRWGYATAFPAAVGIAAAWNPELTGKIGAAIARELKAKGRNCLLGPCVNIHRHPLGGRNFESYGEDPFLASRMAVAFIKGVQSQNALACVKHFACNNQEWERFKLDVTVGERALREIYYPAYKAAVTEAGVRMVMAAYNKLRGDYCSENRFLLKEILKKEWGFAGVVVSDWGGTHSTVKAANNGLDLEMPRGRFFGDKLSEAVKKGEVSEEIIDDKIRRLMRVRFEAGLFDAPGTAAETAVPREEHRQLTREAAKQGLVLLKNGNGILPLDTAKIKSIAVIGPNAAAARTGGGGSSRVTAPYPVSPLEGLKRAAGSGIEIKYAPGIAIRGDILPLRPEYMTPANPIAAEGPQGLWAEYFANAELKGKPANARLDESVDFNWNYDLPLPALQRQDGKHIFSIRWTGRLHPPKTGVYKLDMIHSDGARLYLDNRLLIDNWKKNRVVFRTVSLPLRAGKTYDLRIEYFSDGGISLVKFGWELPEQDTIAEAVSAAKNSDAAIVFAGLHDRFESESFDRQRLELPNQDVLIRAVAEANPNTIVVMQTGGPVLMNAWIHKVPAVIQAWYPGQEGGNAIADILLGNDSPSGKLPCSFIKAYGDSPAFDGYKDKSLGSPYPEGIFVGFRYLDRQGIEPLFPFGHGLSYTTFAYSNLTIRPAEDRNPSFIVEADIKNTGRRKGAEVVQVYVHDRESSLERPEKELKGFRKVFLEPGETRRVAIQLNRDAFAFYHPGQKQWTVEPGEFEIRVGSSSTDIRLKGNIGIEKTVRSKK